MKRHIIIIGSGFGGLSAAIRLAAQGHQVEIFEKRDRPGGKAYVYQTDGYTFDSGPTVITAPFMFDDLWRAAGKRREDYFQLAPCDPYYRIFDHTGRYFDYNGDEQALLAQIERWNPADQDGYQRFMATTQAIFQKGFVELADKPFLHFTDMLRVAPDLIKLRSYLSVYQYVAQFIQDDFLRRCFSFHPLFIGGNPFHSSSIYAMVHYLERQWGIHYAVGGTGAIVAAMARLFAELGGKLHLNAEVQEICVDQRRVAGVRLADGSVHRADIVVSNADVAYTYRNLIAEQHRRKYTNRRLQRLKYSMSLVVIYVGTKRRYTDTALVRHNVIFGERYKGLLTDIFEKQQVAADFSLYLHMPSLEDRALAPEGGETFYVLAPVPHLGSGADWAQLAQPYRDEIIQFLEERYLPGLQQQIAVEHIIDPRHFLHIQNNYLGAAFAIQPTLLQSAWFRPHNQSEEFVNLYFVGAGTHPGAGLPGVLSSAIIVENLIDAA
ncbi:MAG: phytoene desaturase family protein [Chloroflexales bacterium]|nr:phytoene desaturase family protein [Chloroflexales bacterium]